MEASLHVRRRRRGWRQVRRFIARPSGALAALVAVFVLGRLSTTHPARPTVDTPALREAVEVDRSLSDLEAKLTEGEQWVVENTELKRRHERVSALACTAAVAQKDDAVRLAREKAARRRSPPKEEVEDDDSDAEHASASQTASLAGHVLAERHTGSP
jgi:hypothetical protein